MLAQKGNNNYGHYMFKKSNTTKSKYSIVYIPDLYFGPEFHDKFCEELHFFDYYALYIPYARRTEYDDDVEYKEICLDYYVNYAKDLLLSLNLENVFLIGEGLGGTIALFLANLLNDEIVKKIVLVNPFNSESNKDTREILEELPQNIDECYHYLENILTNKSPLLKFKQKSELVIKTMRMICYNIDDLEKIIHDVGSFKTLNHIKKNEKKLNTSCLLISSKKCLLVDANCQTNAYKKNDNIEHFELENSYYLPIIDNYEDYFVKIMKFFVNDAGLNSKSHLPNKELFKYLSDDWKDYYYKNFSQKLIERGKKEEMEEMLKNQKKAMNEVHINNNLSDNEINQFVNKQIENINKMNQEAKIKIETNDKKANDAPVIEIDFLSPPNQIYINKQNISVYHDGKGTGYYKNQNEMWRKIENPKNVTKPSDKPADENSQIDNPPLDPTPASLNTNLTSNLNNSDTAYKFDPNTYKFDPSEYMNPKDTKSVPNSNQLASSMNNNKFDPSEFRKQSIGYVNNSNLNKPNSNIPAFEIKHSSLTPQEQLINQNPNNRPLELIEYLNRKNTKTPRKPRDKNKL